MILRITGDQAIGLNRPVTAPITNIRVVSLNKNTLIRCTDRFGGGGVLLDVEEGAEGVVDNPLHAAGAGGPRPAVAPVHRQVLGRRMRCGREEERRVMGAEGPSADNLVPPLGTPALSPGGPASGGQKGGWLGQVHWGDPPPLRRNTYQTLLVNYLSGSWGS